MWRPVFYLAFLCVSTTLGWARAEAACEPNPSGDPLWFVDNRCAEVVYDPWDGQLFFDSEWRQLTTVEMTSASGIFTGECLGTEDPIFSLCSETKIFKADATGEAISGGSLVVYTEPGLAADFVFNDISIAVNLPPGPGRPLGSWSTEVSVVEARHYIETFTSHIHEGVDDPVVKLVMDQNADGVADEVDRRLWVKQRALTYFGDSDLDGEFTSADIVQVFQAGQYEDGTPANSTWETGDWDGDRDFTSADFITAFQDGGYELGPMLVGVPEPGSLTLLLPAVLVLAAFRRGSAGAMLPSRR